MCAVLAVAVTEPASAQSEDPAAAVERPTIEVTVDCSASPERVTITNNGSRRAKVKGVGSTYRKRPGEPYRVNNTLKPGKRVSYTFGTGKGGGKRLTRSFIFDNSASDEGVLVKTDRGRVKVRCAAGTNAPATTIDQAEPEGMAPTAEPGVVSTDADPRDLLAALPIQAETPDRYDRSLFEHWVDAAGNGCDTRQEVLIRDSLTPADVGVGCRVEGGTWYSAPDGDTLTNPASVDINHVVPLREAWASGASEWTPEQRRDFANDLGDDRTLQAVSAGANRQQGDADPARWLPADRAAACQFVQDWVAIKARWALSVDPLEHDAIALTLEACADTEA